MRPWTWIAVLLTTLLLAGSGGLAALRSRSHTTAPAVETAAPWLRLRSSLAPRLTSLAEGAHGPAGPVGGAVMLAVLSGWALAFGLRERRRSPLRRVLRELRRGCDAPRLARRTGMAQDALRTLLDPRAAGERRPRRREGSSAAEWFSRLGRRDAPATSAWRRCEHGA